MPSPDPNEPEPIPLTEEFEAAQAALPHEPPTSGDFHDAFPLEDGKVGVVLGDVSGHGPAAAAHADKLRDAIAGSMKEGLPPEEAVAFVNAAAEMSPDFPGFATVFAATVESGTGKVDYANAGHEPPLITTPKGEKGVAGSDRVEELPTTGPPVGVAGADEVTYERGEAMLPPGGTLFVYSDGLSEARQGRTFFGVVRLKKLLAWCAQLPPVTLLRKLFTAIFSFIAPGRLRDDAAALALRRRDAAKDEEKRS
jgi:sigma-B regulation protein RsbU (phosphoserine phosphatase)